jgi:hypothetical protein
MIVRCSYYFNPWPLDRTCISTCSASASFPGDPTEESKLHHFLPRWEPSVVHAREGCTCVRAPIPGTYISMDSKMVDVQIEANRHSRHETQVGLFRKQISEASRREKAVPISLHTVTSSAISCHPGSLLKSCITYPICSNVLK